MSPRPSYTLQLIAWPVKTILICTPLAASYRFLGGALDVARLLLIAIGVSVATLMIQSRGLVRAWWFLVPENRIQWDTLNRLNQIGFTDATVSAHQRILARIRGVSFLLWIVSAACWGLYETTPSIRAVIAFVGLVAVALIIVVGWAGELFFRRVFARSLEAFLKNEEYGICPTCHYTLTGLEEVSRCPECGAILNRGAMQQHWLGILRTIRK